MGEDGVRLFRVRCLSNDNRDSRAEQVEEIAMSLSSDDVFILESKDNCWIWKGKESSASEADVARGFMSTLCPDRDFQELDEGSEDDAFWDVLGGKQDYGPPEYRPVFPPRLFHLAKMPSGSTRAIEIHNFNRSDLVEDDIMILDTGREIFVWVGQKEDSEEKEIAMKMAEEYLDTDPSQRDSTNTVILVQGGGGACSLYPVLPRLVAVRLTQGPELTTKEVLFLALDDDLCFMYSV